MAPVALRVVELPLQILLSGPALIVGFAFTVIVAVSVLLQPLASVPVTEYLVVAVGETGNVEPVVPEGDHV